MFELHFGMTGIETVGDAVPVIYDGHPGVAVTSAGTIAYARRSAGFGEGPFQGIRWVGRDGQGEFVSDVRDSVYKQMREERARVATQTRAQGEEAAELIKSTADKDRTILLANAYRDGQIIRGEGDAKAAEVYAKAYSRDAEFYAFYRSISAYRNSMGKPGDLLVLDPNNEFFRYLNQSSGKQ